MDETEIGMTVETARELDRLRAENAALRAQLAAAGCLPDIDLNSDFNDIVDACRSPRISPQLRRELENESDGARRLDRLCSHLIAYTFRRCGLYSETQTLRTVDDVCEQLQVRPGRRPHIQRLLDILQEDQWVRCERNGYRWIGGLPPAYSRIAADAAALEAAFPFATGAAGLLLRCMTALPEVLAGKDSAVAVMFANGSVTELESFYSRFPLLALSNAMVASAVARMAGGRNRLALRVLEIGAGTGALTSSLLPAIENRLDQYVYTDISPSFLTHAQHKFAAHSALRTRLLDIDRDPLAQGLSEESFDVVVGSNVVHASPDVRRSIRHLRRTLVPGGHLILVETVLPSRFADCTVGLFDGWWSFRDPALRHDYPLLSARQWQELLREEGFRSAVVNVGQRDGAAETGIAVLVATRPGVREREAALRSAL